MYRLPPFYKIENFYVESLLGIWLHGRVVPFGSRLEHEYLSDALKQNLYVRFQIGSEEQVQRVATKYGREFKPSGSDRDDSLVIPEKPPLKSKRNT
jgi:hypothetical protein